MNNLVDLTTFSSTTVLGRFGLGFFLKVNNRVDLTTFSSTIYVQMPRLTPIQRLTLLSAIEAGESLKDAADRLNIPRSTAYYTVKKAVQRGDDQRDLPCAGRPRITSSAADERLIRSIRRNHNDSWAEILKRTPLSKATVKKRIKEIDPNLKRFRQHSRPFKMKS